MDTLSLILSIVVVLASLLAFFIQRARYFREIEPDLEISWLSGIKISTLGQTLGESWFFNIDVEVENKSKNHGYELQFKPELWIFPKRGEARFFSVKFPQFHQTNVLAGRRKTESVHFGLNHMSKQNQNLYQKMTSMIVEEAGFFAYITLEYYTNKELIILLLSPWSLFVLSPWNWGRKKYTRSIGDFNFMFSPNKSEEPPYTWSAWNFRDEENL